MDELKTCFGGKLNRTYRLIDVGERKESRVTLGLLLDISGCIHRCQLMIGKQKVVEGGEKRVDV